MLHVEVEQIIRSFLGCPACERLPASDQLDGIVPAFVKMTSSRSAAMRRYFPKLFWTSVDVIKAIP